MASLVRLGTMFWSPSATLSVPGGVTCSSERSSDFFVTALSIATVLDREEVPLEGEATLPGWAALTLSDLATILLPESDRCPSGKV